MHKMYSTDVALQETDSHLNTALQHPPLTEATLLPIEGSKVNTAGATITRWLDLGTVLSCEAAPSELLLTMDHQCP